jgi:type II secretory pathway pseudopilin PulG
VIPASTSRLPSQDGGETLVEILMAVVIMGIVMTGLIAGLTTTTIASDAHRRLSDVEVVARNYGEGLVKNATHPSSTQLASTAASGSGSVVVTSNTGFPAAFTASVDGEVVAVSSVSAATGGNWQWTLSGSLAETHAAGVTAIRYQPCPTATDLTYSGFTTSSQHIGTPAVTAVEYFGAPTSIGAQPPGLTAAQCATYWQITGLPCAAQDTLIHFTECDPPLLRATITVSSTDATTSARSAATTTRVLLRRGNP